MIGLPSGFGRSRRRARLLGGIDKARAVLLVAAFSIAVLGSHPIPARGQDGGVASERAVKAAYLYQFAGYIQWPAGKFEDAESPIVIGVVGDAPIAEELMLITRERTVNGRAIAVRVVEPDAALLGLHVLFMADEVGPRVTRIAERAHAESVLTVTESSAPGAPGSVINLRISDRRIRFEVFLDRADESGLRLNARLLAVAQRVHERTA